MRHTAAHRGGSSAFEVELRKSGIVLTVPPTQSILATIEAANISTPSFCRNGMCGTCELRILSGTPDHRDTFLTQPERVAGQSIMICVSRAAPGSRLVLDL